MCVSVLWIFFAFFLAKKIGFFKKALICTIITYQMIYIVWRAIFTLPIHYGILNTISGIILLIAEALCVWKLVVFNLLFYKPYGNSLAPISRPKTLPTVDVFVLTYDESIDLMKKTLTACKNLSYPRQLLNIYLCDDGKREEMRLLCARLNVHYVTRKNRSFAKAGNLNNALKQGNGYKC